MVKNSICFFIVVTYRKIYKCVLFEVFMSLEKISTGNELKISRERILDNQRTEKRKKNVPILIRSRNQRQRVDKRPVIVTPLRINPLGYQKVEKRFSVLRYLVPAIVIPAVVGIPVGRYLANNVKENRIRTEVGRKADYDMNGVADENERAIFYHNVFGKTGINGLSLDEIYKRIIDYSSPVSLKK